jgi:hypothetical protein
MTKGVSLTTLAIISHGVVLLPPFALAHKSPQELLEVFRYQNSQSALYDQKLVRPSPQERESVSKFIDMKPARWKMKNRGKLRGLVS